MVWLALGVGWFIGAAFLGSAIGRGIKLMNPGEE
jgi:hypothetical protein